MIKEYFHIAHLISRHLSGEVTPEENRFLDKWRKESKSHEQLFQKICSDEYYEQELSSQYEEEVGPEPEAIEPPRRRKRNTKITSKRSQKRENFFDQFKP